MASGYENAERPEQGWTLLMALIPLLGPVYLFGLWSGWWYWAENEATAVVFVTFPLAISLAVLALARSIRTLRALGAAGWDERALAVLAALLSTVSILFCAWLIYAIVGYFLFADG